MNNTINTFSGGTWNLLDPQPDDVRIEDIAHALSMACRFGGHVRKFYSVAEHVVRCAWFAEEESLYQQMHNLLHDASEAYIGDVVRPLKVTMPDYQRLEAITMDAVYCGLNLMYPNVYEHERIKVADDTLLVTEQRDLFGKCQMGHYVPRPPLKTHVEGWSPDIAEDAFLRTYHEILAKFSLQNQPNNPNIKNTNEALKFETLAPGW